MLKRLYENKKAIVMYSSEKDIPVLMSHEWDLMDKVTRLLAPFHEVTVRMSNEDSNISEVLPIVEVFKRFLSSESVAGVKTIRDEMLSSFRKRFAPIQMDKNYKLATMVDPRYKTAFAIDSQSDCHHLLLEEVIALGLTGSECEAESTTPITDDKKSDGDFNFWTCLDDLKQQHQQDKKPSTNPPDSLSATLEQEVKSFTSCPLLQTDGNPYYWWSEKKCTYPHVYAVAMRYLSAPSSSVYSERLFSEGGDIFTAARNRLAPHKGEQLLFLHHNLSRLDFCY